MKKIITLLIAVLMLCTLSIPAFAADELPSLDYTSNFNETISQSVEYAKIQLAPPSGATGTMTIDGKAIVTVGSLQVFNSELIIKSGSILQCKGNFTIGYNGTVTIEEGAKLILLSGEYGYYLDKQGIIYNGDYHKKLQIENKLIVKGELLGEVDEYDKYSNSKNNIEIRDNGVIKLNYGVVNMYNIEHSGDIDYFEEDLKKNTNHIVTRDKDNKTIVAELTHHLDNDYCIYCGYVADSHVHDFSDDGICSCNAVCQHENGFTGGKCNDCPYMCPHNGNTCVVCGETVNGGNIDIGSALSEGNMTIIIAIAALVIGLGGGFLLGKIKKKPALASGADNNDEEE